MKYSYSTSLDKKALMKIAPSNGGKGINPIIPKTILIEKISLNSKNNISLSFPILIYKIADIKAIKKHIKAFDKE